MSKRQIQKMLQLMAGGEPVQLTSPMASVKKLARLAFIAQQFGYEYADARQTGSRNNALVMMIVPDPSPHARARAAQNWAQYPNAGDGVSLPPLVPDAVELLKARINFDLTGRHSEKQRLGYAAVAITVGSLLVGVNIGGDIGLLIGGIMWAVTMGLLGFAITWGRKRNAKFAALLQAAGFAPVTDESGRLRYLPPGGQMPGHGNPFGGAPFAGAPVTGMPGGGYGQQVPAQGPGPYGQQQVGGAYAPQQPPAPYAQSPAPGPNAPGPYTPQQPYGYQQQPHGYGQPPQHPGS
ncbi:hypothetical protein [Streptomyces sp. HC307]|uniref:hypothetical protein n=1 Tax=Streptomyces flavusporus TaxID=3385496 RepID=UPI003916F521